MSVGTESYPCTEGGTGADADSEHGASTTAEDHQQQVGPGSQCATNNQDLGCEDQRAATARECLILFVIVSPVAL